MKKTERWIWLSDWLLIGGVVYALLRCLQTAYQLPLSAAPVFWVLLLPAIGCAVFRGKRAWIAALVGLALLVAAGFAFPEVTENLRQLCLLVLKRLTDYYGWIAQLISPEQPEQVKDYFLAFLALAAVMTWLFCICFVWLRATLPGILWCIVLLSPCFFLVNRLPDSRFLVMLLICLLALAFSLSVRRRAPEEAARAAGWSLLPALLIAGVLVLCFPAKSYTPPVDFAQLSRGFASLGQQLDAGISGTDVNTNGVDLRTLGPKQQRTYTVLEVRADAVEGNYLYLRGVAYEQFDGASWSLPAQTPAWERDGTPLDSGLWTYQTAQVTVHSTRVEEVLYTPENPTAVPYPTIYDWYVPNTDNIRDYSYTVYLLNGANGATQDFRDMFNTELRELMQARAARDCLYLPEQTRQALLQIAADNGLIAISSPTGQVQAVLSFVQSCAVYDLNPARVPAGKDFCTWFLTEAEGGYCVHFATVATAMYRALGIPARYVEGYVTTAEAGQTAYIEQRQAHAWVEICVGGVWKLVDPTPPDGLQQTVAPRLATGETLPTRPTEPSSEPTEESADTTPTEPSSTLPTEAPTDPSEPQTSQTDKSFDVRWLWLLVLPALAGAVVGLRQGLRRSRRKRRARLRGNELALWDYHRYERLCRICRTKPGQTPRALAQKARFSQHTLTAPELASIAESLRRQEVAVTRLPTAKRLWYSYWLL